MNQSNLLFWVVLSFTIYLRGNQAVSIRIWPMTGSSLLHTVVYPSFQQPSSFYIYSIFWVKIYLLLTFARTWLLCGTKSPLVPHMSSEDLIFCFKLLFFRWHASVSFICFPVPGFQVHQFRPFLRGVILLSIYYNLLVSLLNVHLKIYAPLVTFRNHCCQEISLALYTQRPLAHFTLFQWQGVCGLRTYLCQGLIIQVILLNHMLKCKINLFLKLLDLPWFYQPGSVWQRKRMGKKGWECKLCFISPVYTSAEFQTHFKFVLNCFWSHVIFDSEHKYLISNSMMTGMHNTLT